MTGTADSSFDRLAVPYDRGMAPLERLGRIRSAGITDLRHGSVHDEDWQGRDRFAHGNDPRRPLPLPPDVRCYAIAGTIGGAKAPLRDRVLGDGLVPVPSALGQHRDARFALAFPKSHQWIAGDTSHFDLLGRAARAGFCLQEVPYRCVPRLAGESKTGANLWDYLVKGRKYVTTILAVAAGR